MEYDPTAIIPSPASTNRLLTTEAFHQLSQMPLELEWLANIDNLKTQKAYHQDVQEFMA